MSSKRKTGPLGAVGKKGMRKKRTKEALTKVAVYCPNCGETLPSDTASCMGCGKRGDDNFGNEEADYDLYGPEPEGW